MADCGLGPASWRFRGLGPPRGPLLRADSESPRKLRRTHPSRASGTGFEAFLGPEQFQVRTREAILHFTYGGLRIEADCSPDEHWADCGLHVGRPAI
eukprot:7818809-Alexandrium_andersonii.AAC.1